MNFDTKLDTLSDDDLWHIAVRVAFMSGGSLFNVSKQQCVTELRASFMDPDTGRAFIEANTQKQVTLHSEPKHEKVTPASA